MSTNVFAELELPNPEERLMKAQFVPAIRQLVKQSGLTQTQLAQKVNMTQPAISRMLKGMTRDISVEKLLSVVILLGHNVVVSIDNRVTDDSQLQVIMANQSLDEREPAIAAV